MREAAVRDQASAGQSLRGVAGDIAVRCFVVALLLTPLVSSGRHGLPTGVSVALGAAVLVLTFDRRNPFSLRNFFLLYTVALFALGAPLLRLASMELYVDLLIYVGAFFAGYTVSGLGKIKATRAPPKTMPARLLRLDRIRVVEELMLLVGLLQVSFLAFKVYTYGFGAFYGGQPLFDQFSNYGRASVSGGLIQVVTFLLKFGAIAAVMVYVRVCLQAGVRIQYRYPLVLLVVLPVVSLARSDALIGATFVMVINALERRFASRHPHERPTARERRVARGPSGRTLVVGAALAVALPAGLVIGGLRQTQPTKPSASPLERSLPFLQSELTPILAYVEIKDRQDLLERTHGRTILPPLLLKLVPRGLLPTKPINSGAYYMSKVRPAEFAAGYALPPTLFGDAYLNFGMAGAVAACLVAGFIAARLDRAYKYGRLSCVPGFLLTSVNMYGLLRNALSESLSAVILIGLAYLLSCRLVGVPRAHQVATHTEAGG